MPRSRNWQRETKTCESCGKEFQTGGRGNPPRTARFCSRSCSAQQRVFRPTIGLLSATEAAYIAAMVDGEGSIILTKRPPSRRLSLRVIVVNTDYGLMTWLARFGGNVNTRTIPSPLTITPKPVHTWTINGSNAVSVLTQLLPYLIIKRERAELAIASQPRAPNREAMSSD